MDKIDRFDGTKYGFLSNFYMRPIWYDGLLYPSSEHAYQAAKTTDIKLREAFTRMITPGETKKYGRKLQLRDNWDNIKARIMFEIVLIKFVSHFDLRQKLLDTGNIELIEGNTWGDTFFGVCNGVGENNLGKILMEVRRILKGL